METRRFDWPIVLPFWGFCFAAGWIAGTVVGLIR